MPSHDDNDFATIGLPRPPTPSSGDQVLGHYLVVLDGVEPGRIIEITEVCQTIGRDPRQVLVFADSELSRLHAQITLVAGHVVVEDCRSTNGTFVDGVRIETPIQMREGSLLQIGQQVLKYERRDRRDVERSQELSRELMKATAYVMSLLPPAIETGRVTASWRFLPSTQLGGDVFGYHWVDEDTFMMYLVDVSGHGLGAAMHSVSVMNVLRQQALPGVDFTNPAAVLATLNDRFQMDTHNGMFFTIWYGIYRASTRRLSYSTAGHHAASLVPADKSAATPLAVPGLMIGAMPEMTYDVEHAQVAPGSSLYLFSDGVFEIIAKDQQQWGLTDFVSHMLAPSVPGTTEPDRLYQTVKAHARPGLLDDDFSLVVFTFE